MSNQRMFSWTTRSDSLLDRISAESVEAFYSRCVRYLGAQSQVWKGRWENLELDRYSHLLIAVAAVLVVSVLTAGLYLNSWYEHFDRLVEAKQPSSVLEVSGLYGRPVAIAKGQRWSAGLIERTLAQAGYKLDAWGGDGAQRRLEASLGGSLTEIQVRRRNGADQIVSIRQDGEETGKITTQPPFLSNLYGDTRIRTKRVHREELPPHLIHAILAVEDRDFYLHWGVDIDAVLRAAWINLREWKVVQGASTLTQQFVKNYYLSPDRTLARKAKEAVLAYLIEQKLDKDQILTLYANQVYLGQVGTYSIRGFGEAADAYFGKPVGDLTLAEAALFAGMIQAPNRFSPLNDREAAKARRNLVLKLMHGQGWITAWQAIQASAEPIEIPDAANRYYLDAPYFLDYVQRQLQKEAFQEYLNKGQAVRIQTTLDFGLQRAAFAAVAGGLAYIEEDLLKGKAGEDLQSAVVSLDPRTGEILAMVGGRDYSASQFNRAVEAYRQPGSTFKPFVYATALSPWLNPEPYTTASLLLDTPTEYEGEPGEELYQPNNYDKTYKGVVNLRNALALSRNAPTVHLAGSVGFDRVAKFANRLGFKNDIKLYPSVALGTIEVNLLELAGAYTIFVNDGRRLPVRAIEEIGIGEEKIQIPLAEGEQVLDPQTAFLVSSILQSAIEWGTGSSARRRGFLLPAAGKTGTSRDSWFVGYTPDLMTAVWVGYDDNRDLGLTGSEAALHIWTSFMKHAQELGYLAGKNFKRPEGLVTITIDPETGMRVGPFSDVQRSELFIKGTAPDEDMSRLFSSLGSSLGGTRETVPISLARDSAESIKRASGNISSQ